MPSDLVIAQGLRRTRATFELWHSQRWRVLIPWFAGSFTIAVLLLLGVWVSSQVFTPDDLRVPYFGVFPESMIAVLERNALVLALHAMACVAGFIAGSSLPLEAQRYGPRWRAIHDHAGRLAMIFVSAATLFSLTTQALILGFGAATIADRLDTSAALLLVCVLPHAIPELVALFLPLAAWLLASRNEDWDHLLAATFVTVGIATPMLIVASWIEVNVSPDVVRAVIGT
jgi:hypothetical protein